MKKTTTLSLLTAACVGFASTASAAVIFSTDFDSETLGQVTPAGTGITRTGNATSLADVTAATGSFASQFLNVTSRGGSNVSYGFSTFDGDNITASTPTFASVTTFSFDLEILTAATQLRLRARDTAFSGGTTDTARFDLDSGADLAINTVANVQYVVNNSSLVADAPDVGGTIAAGSYAVYIGGVLAGSGTNFTAADDNAVNQLTLWVRGDTATTTQGVVRIDNFEVHTVPEPSTYALLAGALALGFVMVRRRK